MTTSYDPSLPTDKDWVRFFIGDTNLDAEFVDLQDEEILAVLGDERNKYLAAARCGEVIIGKKQGVVSKNVDNLSLTFGDSPESAYRAHLERLREDGANRLLLNKRVFRAL